MQFLRRALDEPGAEHCGKCSSCLQHPLLSPDIDSGLLHAANLFIKHADLSLNLNKQVAAGAFTQYGFKGNLPASLQGSTGRILSRWGYSGWGKQVAQEKKTGRFSDDWWRHVRKWFANAGIRILNQPGYAAFLH